MYMVFVYSYVSEDVDVFVYEDVDVYEDVFVHIYIYREDCHPLVGMTAVTPNWPATAGP